MASAQPREGCLQEGGTSSRFALSRRRADGAERSWTPAAERRGQAQVPVPSLAFKLRRAGAFKLYYHSFAFEW